MRKIFVLLFAAALTLALAAPSSAFNMKGGKWKMSVEVTMEGLPIQMPPQTSTSFECLEEQDAVPNPSNEQQDCEILEQKVKGDTVSWKIRCKGDDADMEGEGEMTYKGTKSSGKARMKMIPKGRGQGMTFSYKFNGERVGDCK